MQSSMLILATFVVVCVATISPTLKSLQQKVNSTGHASLLTVCGLGEYISGSTCQPCSNGGAAGEFNCPPGLMQLGYQCLGTSWFDTQICSDYLGWAHAPAAGTSGTAHADFYAIMLAAVYPSSAFTEMAVQVKPPFFSWFTPSGEQGQTSALSYQSTDGSPWACSISQDATGRYFFRHSSLGSGGQHVDYDIAYLAGSASAKWIASFCPTWPMTCPAGQYISSYIPGSSGVTQLCSLSCQPCSYGSTYLCPLGQIQTGRACSGSGSGDTQTCTGCQNGGSVFTCPQYQYRTGTQCLGDSAIDSQTCAAW